VERGHGPDTDGSRNGLAQAQLKRPGSTGKWRPGRSFAVAESTASGQTGRVSDSFLAFLGISAIVIVTPGQDTALTVRNTLLGGRSAGIATAAGVAAGQAIWTIGASFGLTALLVASETAFLAIRLAGGAYLVYLGAHSIWSAVRLGEREASRGPGVRAGLTAPSALRQGLISNLGNPKMIIFFASLLPQFIAPGSPAPAGMLTLGLVFVSMTLGWLMLYAAFIDRARGFLNRGPIRRAFDAITGAILVAFGARLTVEPR
jgi:threonine/homoserine/homoserine lactone efflux protein